jgi:hypothetical protein
MSALLSKLVELRLNNLLSPFLEFLLSPDIIRLLLNFKQKKRLHTYKYYSY